MPADDTELLALLAELEKAEAWAQRERADCARLREELKTCRDKALEEAAYAADVIRVNPPLSSRGYQMPELGRAGVSTGATLARDAIRALKSGEGR